MSDQDEKPTWPREIWMAEREEHDQGVVSAVLSEHATIARFEGDTEREREFHRYVDGDIYDIAEKYWRARLDQKIDALDVKPLEWRRGNPMECADWVDTTETYHIEDAILWYAFQEKGTLYEDDDAAKAAAQADYERRIRAALKGGAE